MGNKDDATRARLLEALGRIHGRVADSYPIFLQVREALWCGKTIFPKLTPFLERERFSEKELNAALTTAIEATYLDAVLHPDVSDWCVLKRIGQCSIEELKAGKYKLLFLHSPTETILLNYTMEDGQFSPLENYYIARPIENEESHVKEFCIAKKDFEVINTFYAFINFADAYGKELNLALNDPFFEGFWLSMFLVTQIPQGFSMIRDLKKERLLVCVLYSR